MTKTKKRKTLRVISFGFRNGLPADADMVIDVRFLDNPHWDLDLRPLSGLDAPVAARIRKDKSFAKFFKQLTGLLKPLLARYGAGDKSLTIAIGCTGGRHRSVFFAKELHGWLEAQGFAPLLRHRDMKSWARRRGLADGDKKRPKKAFTKA